MRACSPPTRRSSSARNTATRRCSSITPPASCSTIRRCTPMCAARSRWRCRTASSPRWRRGSSRWSTGCSTRWQRKGRADLIEDFAAAIPVEIIGNLLGVPHADRGPLRGWSLAILGALEPVLTPEQMALGNDAVRDFSAYLKGLVEDRRRKPGRSREGSADAADRRRARRPQAHRDRAVAELHLHPQRRPRDHDQSDRQCAGDFHPLSRRAAAADRKSRR